DLRSGVGVRGCPPDLQRVDARLLSEFASNLVVDGWRNQANVAGNQKKLGSSVVHRHNPVIKVIEHTGGLPGVVAQKPLWLVGSDIHFHDRSPEIAYPGAPSTRHSSQGNETDQRLAAPHQFPKGSRPKHFTPLSHS